MDVSFGASLNFWIAIVFSFVPATEAAVDLTSPYVFNSDFYISRNAEVVLGGIHTPDAAIQHWLSYGIQHGLQACGSFHSKQYLARYSDLRAAFGSDTQKAVEHYLELGIKENRIGYVEGGFEDRWTVSDPRHGLFVRASTRMGAAVDSVVWNHKEFINAYDHGRELQMAMNFGPWGECFNPTEAGGRDDSQQPTTKTQILGVRAAGNKLDTTVLPAFWLRPGTRETESQGASCGANAPAQNTVETYPYHFSKSVVLDCPGVSTACMIFLCEFHVEGTIPTYDLINFEAPTGYMTGEFTVARSVEPTTGALVAYDMKKPIVMSTPDDQFAMGVYAPLNQDSDEFIYYGLWHFPFSIPADASNKWNVVFRKHPQPPGSTYVLHTQAYICVGTVADVVNCLSTLLRQHGSIVG